ncbi:hypothetical protein SAMN04487995_1515 [Dyadobacter koreensis]|uniref:DoxX protein n=1 Tax=Dyadobacter koreensis TaxID=408657 RepID=A0A1H6S681_9BACT|nr:DoxX family membrane protein [Dyadobacter koreensis]SEI58912.1 hypothetical protein SAMN04487995_1515 [Dyadobacter koreensis]
MRIAAIIVRVLMGLMFVFSAAVFFFKLIPVPEMTGPIKTFNEGLEASGYFMPFLKAVETIAGLALIAGLFVPLATVVIFPITINIFLVHLFLAPEGIPIAIFMFAGNLFLAYYYRKHYTSMLVMK